MLKSVFSKYLVTFLVVITVSFLILAITICSMLSGHTARAKEETVMGGSAAVASFIKEGYLSSDTSMFTGYVYFNRSMLRGAFALYVANSEDLREVYLCDERGEWLLSSLEEDTTPDVSMPTAILDQVKEGNTYRDYTTFDGMYEEKRLISVHAVTDAEGKFLGAVMLSSMTDSISGLVESMLKTILATCLLVMAAAMLAVYVTSEKISGPLRDMSRAAKEYAAGRFDVRVPVHGSGEIADLATAFNNMASSLENVEEQRRTFLANVSHDLRTPMTTIAGFIDGILDGAIPEESQAYYLELIASEVRRLSRLVSSLLDISRIQAGERKFTMTAFDLCEMARQILISMEQRIDEKKLDIVFQSDRDNMSVYADRDAIYQVLYNLCDNAVKFTTPSGELRLTITARDHKVSLSVWNMGEGIAADDLPYVFDRFYKGDKSRGLDKTGAGLGLYISKTIMDAHKAPIRVKSEAGKWCEFTFTLPEVLE